MNTALITVNREDFSIIVPTSVEEMKNAALGKSALIGVVRDEESNAAAVEAERDLKIYIAAVEKARTTAKDPVLECGRQIDATAKALVAEAKSEQLRVNTLSGNYNQEKLDRVRELERQRQHELDRIERERQAEVDRIAAEQRKLEEARRAELARIAAEEAKAKNAKQRAELEAQRVKIEVERKQQEQARIAEEKRQAELHAVKTEMVGPAAVIETAKGQTIKTEYDFEVVDVWALARGNPGLVNIEARRGDIRDLINKHGQQKIPGLRIFEIIKNNVRTNPGRVINV